jgi:hypothetical protein
LKASRTISVLSRRSLAPSGSPIPGPVGADERDSHGCECSYGCDHRPDQLSSTLPLGDEAHRSAWCA